jgi:Zn-dependent peptidase ImmA (M78 family)
VDVFAPTLSSDNRSALAQWRSGRKQPTFNQLEKFSKAIRIPIGYFFLTNPPAENLKLLEFRTVDSLSLQNPSRDLIDTVRQMENVQEWMQEYIMSSQGEKNSFVGSLDINNSDINIATTVRTALKLPINWYEENATIEASFKALRQRISDIGIIIMMSGIVGLNTHRNLNVDEFRAFTLIDEYAPLIFINAADAKNGQLFSILHEFIHIGIGTSSLFNAGTNDSIYVNPNEKLCNAITAEILVPISIFREKWQIENGDYIQKIETLSVHFKCSTTVIARRALDDQRITNNEYNDIIQKAKQYIKRKKKSGGNFNKTQASRIDHRFLLALDSSLHEGRTLHTEAFRLTNTNQKTFDQLVNEVRGRQK